MPYLMVLDDKVRISAQRKRTQRVRRAQFGDGYEQTTADGINSFVDAWQNVGWDNLSSTELDTARSMLEGVGGTDYIRWTPPGEVAEKRFKVVDGWTESYQPGGLYSITFDLKEVW